MTAALDTDILVYLLSTDERKLEVSRQLLVEDVTISVQVLNELTNVGRRKAKLDWSEIARLVKSVKALCAVTPLTVRIHDEGRRLAERYRLSTCDALICAAALGAGVGRLYSEDMQHGLVIDNAFRIVNPYLATDD